MAFHRLGVTACLLASAAAAAGPAPATRETFAFLGWGESCSVALEHAVYGPRAPGLPEEAREVRVGTLALPPGEDIVRERWLFDSRGKALWGPEDARPASERLRSAHPARGFVERLRPMPAGPESALLLSTAAFSSRARLEAPFALSMVYYHPLGHCALLLLEAGASPKVRYRWALARLKTPAARRLRSRAHLDLALARYAEGSLEEAAQELAVAADMDPREGAVRYHRAAILATQGFFEGALAELRAAVRLEPSWAAKARSAVEFVPLKDDEAFLAIIR